MKSVPVKKFKCTYGYRCTIVVYVEAQDQQGAMLAAESQADELAEMLVHCYYATAEEVPQ